MKKLICYSLVFLLAFANDSQADVQNFGFAGEKQNQNLSYLRSRYYDAETGTFLTKDPLGVTGGPNSYQYASSNPVNVVDPEGNYGLLIVAALALALYFSSSSMRTAWAPTSQADLAAAANEQKPASTVILDVGLPVGGAVAGLGIKYGLAGAAPYLGPIVTRGVGTVADGLTFTGGTGNAFAGHGVESAMAGTTIVPEGTTIMIPGQTGLMLPDTIGRAIENGDWDQVIQLTNENSNWAARMEGSSTALPGAEVPNLILKPPGTLDVAENSMTVSSDTLLSDLLQPNMGNLDWAACRYAPGISSAFSTGQLNVGTIGLAIGGGLALSDSDAVGGVLIDKAATLVNQNLSDITGATFDPISKQLVFLGSNTPVSSTALDMDYFYTAVESIYGSAVPPFVSLDTPAYPYTPWTDYGNNDGIWESGEENGFVLRYDPLWANEDSNIDVRIISNSTDNTQHYDFTLHFAVAASNNPPPAGGRQAMRLSYTGATNLPSGMTVDTSVLQGPVINLTPTSQDSYWTVALANQTAYSISTPNVSVIPDRQHRRYGGRVDGTRLGWVMYQADRVMKCLSVGKDNLTGATYDHTNVVDPTTHASFGYQNLIERAEAAGTNGTFSRLWFEPDVMNLQRYVDPASGKATVVFQTSTVELLTEAYLQGQPQDPLALAFANHFTTNYDEFAKINFPVEDPETGATISAPIFALLKQAMQAVAIGRFLHDNNIPLDMWWLNSWQPQATFSRKSTPTAYNTSTSGNIQYVVFGGVQTTTPNSYVPSANAQNVGQLVTTARLAVNPSNTQDLKPQSWNANVGAGTTYNAVATSMTTDSQDGNVNLAEPDLAFASPGELPLAFIRYYQSSWLGTGNMGPGWRDTRYVLQFSNPSWFDQSHLMLDSAGNPIATDTNSDTKLRSGTVRMVDLATGAILDFQSSVALNYTVDPLGNPSVSVAGLTSDDIPTFTAGQHQSGASLKQTPDANKWYVITMADGSSLAFDSNGNLLQTVDRHGYSQWYAYDSLGRLSTITDSTAPTPQVITLAYTTATNTVPSLLQSATGPRACFQNDLSQSKTAATRIKLRKVRASFS